MSEGPGEGTVGSARTGTPAPHRLATLDALRGLVIVLMVLDHVRDFFHRTAMTADPLALDSGDPALFLTRWVTHPCAPTFVFLAGVSIWLQREGGGPTPALSRYLATRGLWLIGLELVVVGTGFNFGWWIFLQVLWAIGVGMIVMALLIRAPRALVLGLGVAIVTLHPLLQGVPTDAFGAAEPLWRALASPGFDQTPAGPLLVAYPAIPWLGVMLLSYGIGPWFRMDAPGRRRLAGAALGLLAVFAVLRLINLPGFDPRPWAPQADPLWTMLSLIDVSKYPPSPAYVCLTLALALGLYLGLERCRPGPSNVLITFGRTPLFTYLLHIWLAHGLALLTGLAMGLPVEAFGSMFLQPNRLPDAGWGFGLPIVFGAWLGVLCLLYPPARAFAGLKARRPDWTWLRYL